MLGRVLVIENRITFAKEVCRELNDHGCEAIMLPIENAIDRLREKEISESDYKEETLKMVHSVIKNNSPVDVVVCNLHLIKEPEHIGYPLDFIGTDILDYIKKNHPGICCAVWSGHLPANVTDLITKYNLASIVNKQGSSRVQAICEAVLSILRNGHPVIKNLGRKYMLDGVNSQIYRFLFNNDVMQKVFGEIPEFDNRIVKALGGSFDEPIVETIQLMADLWHLEAGLPHYPLINELCKLEFGRAFWEENRDHIHHQLLVYLCGLYLYYGCDLLRSALDKVVTENEFLLSWKISALFHDLGYVFEVEYFNQSTINKDVFKHLNTLYKKSLFHYSEARNLSVLEAEDTRLFDFAQMHTQEVSPIDIDSLTRLANEDLFLIITDAAKKSYLGETDECLRNYWQYTQTGQGNRTKFIDHGIASALVLLQQYKSLKNYIEKALPALNESENNVVTKDTYDLIGRLHEIIPEYQKEVIFAAEAIALHNIDIDNWNHGNAFIDKSLTLNRYELSLQRTPLAFFLKLVDTIQFWDRPKYKAPDELDYILQAQDIIIRFTNGKIFIAFKNDELSGTSQSKFSKVYDDLTKCMNKSDLDELFEEATQKTSAGSRNNQ